jgi:nicotinamidase-related amidase
LSFAEFDNSRAALLVMDVQQGVVARFSDDAEVLLERLSALIGASREAGIAVIYVRVAFRAGNPEVSPRNRSFAALTHAGGFGESDAATQIHPAVAPRPEDPVVVKKRVSAFSGSDLELLLCSLAIETLILTGIATSGVVLSTIREAADRDYRLVVLSDCCLDGDPEVHRVLTEKVFPRQADVVSADELLRRLNRD